MDYLNFILQGFLIGAGVFIWLKLERAGERRIRKIQRKRETQGLNERQYEQVFSIVRELEHSINHKKKKK